MQEKRGKPFVKFDHSALDQYWEWKIHCNDSYQRYVHWRDASNNNHPPALLSQECDRHFFLVSTCDIGFLSFWRRLAVEKIIILSAWKQQAKSRRGVRGGHGSWIMTG